MRLEATGVRKSEGRYYERRGSVYERFLCALFATVVKPISDFRLLIYGLCVMLFALCSVAEAQPPAKVRRIGVLTPRSPSDSALWHQAIPAKPSRPRMGRGKKHRHRIPICPRQARPSS
jgi:hypothetical protein